jgi:hypothetical protein
MTNPLSALLPKPHDPSGFDAMKATMERLVRDDPDTHLSGQPMLAQVL